MASEFVQIGGVIARREQIESIVYLEVEGKEPGVNLMLSTGRSWRCYGVDFADAVRAVATPNGVDVATSGDAYYVVNYYSGVYHEVPFPRSGEEHECRCGFSCAWPAVLTTNREHMERLGFRLCANCRKVREAV